MPSAQFTPKLSVAPAFEAKVGHFKTLKECEVDGPTISTILKSKDREGWRMVRVPLVTGAAGVKFEPIHIGGRFGTLTMKPGETKELPPDLATEVEDAIRRFEKAPIHQMTGNESILRAVEIEQAQHAAFQHGLTTAAR